MSKREQPNSRFFVVEKLADRSNSLPEGTRLIAHGDELDDLLEPLGKKAGIRLDLDLEFDPDYRRHK